MFSFLVAIVASMALSAPSAIAVAPPAIEVDTQYALDFACSVMDYDCSNVPVPEVRFAPLYGPYGALGIFNPREPTVVYLDSQLLPYLDDTYIHSILAHELTHYLDFGRTPDIVLCDAEWNGWRVGNVFLVVHGRPDLTDFTWFLRYGCFR